MRGLEKTEVRGQRSEVGSQRSEVGSQRSEVRGQRSEDWKRQKSVVRGQRSEVRKEDPKQAILLVDYYEMFKKTGWTLTHIIQAPMSSERFNAGVVSTMQKKKILGVTSRYVMLLK